MTHYFLRNRKGNVMLRTCGGKHTNPLPLVCWVVIKWKKEIVSWLLCWADGQLSKSWKQKPLCGQLRWGKGDKPSLSFFFSLFEGKGISAENNNFHTVMSWAGVQFPVAALTVLCSALVVDNALVFWVLLSSTGTTSALSLNIPHIKGLGVGKIPGWDTTRPADPK